jgi:alpha,alpha-trehalase
MNSVQVNFEDLLRTMPHNMSDTSQQDLLKEFYRVHFDSPGSDLTSVFPRDLNVSLILFPEIPPLARTFAQHVHLQWRFLVRQFTPRSDCKGCTSSFIPVPRPFVVPGGRFLEFYYWDSYWILKGLLVSRMYETARDLLLNMISLIDQYGFIPNGIRVYYTTRSQPPMFLMMLYEYIQAVGDDDDMLKRGLGAAEREYTFWMEHRLDAATGLNRFVSMSTEPRPESYVEDSETALQLNDTEDRLAFYGHVAAGAESGWDFSARWMPYKDGQQMRNMAELETNSVVPVDLNAIMFQNEMILFRFHAYIDCKSASEECRSFLSDSIASLNSVIISSSKAQQHLKAAQRRSALMTSYFWHAKDRSFYDIDTLSHNHRKWSGGYLSALYPLWTRAFNASIITCQDQWDMIDHFMEQLQSFPGGVPTSRQFSGQQWDFPNAWPPLQWIVVEALLNTAKVCTMYQTQIQSLALDVVRRYLRTTYCGYRRKPSQTRSLGQEDTRRYYQRRRRSDGLAHTPETEGALFEKYDVRYIGRPGDGGEYVVQVGFGWTNGVILDFMQRFPELAVLSDDMCAITDRHLFLYWKQLLIVMTVCWAEVVVFTLVLNIVWSRMKRLKVFMHVNELTMMDL